MKRLGLVAWAVATLLSVWIATQAVALVRDEVTQPPLPVAQSIVVATSPATSAQSSAPASTTPATTSTLETSGSTTSTSSTTVSSSSEPPASTTPSPSTTTAAPGTTTAPSTTAPPSTTSPPTTTAAPPTTTTVAPQLQTHQLAGGWVRILVGADTVSLDGAAPAVGFTMEVTADGPGKVEVRFRSDDHDSRFEAEWEDGELEIDIDESD